MHAVTHRAMVTRFAGALRWPFTIQHSLRVYLLGLMVCIFAPLWLQGCGGGGGGAASPQGATATDTATIGQSGGALMHADGVKISVPAGALAEAVTLRVARDTTGMNAALLGVAPDPAQSVDLSATYAMTPHGTHFAAPVELRIPLNAAATGPGMLAVLRTEPGRGSWELRPVTKVEGGSVVVLIDGFSFYKVVRVIQLPSQLPNLPAAPPQFEVTATFDGVGPENYTIPSPTNPNNQHLRLYGEITSRTQSLRYAGHVVGVPASCSNISLNGSVVFPSSARAEDARGGVGPHISAEPVFAWASATPGTSVVNGITRPTLDFAIDLTLDNAPYKSAVFNALRAGSNTGPTPTVAVSFNAWARCTTPVDLGGGNVITEWQIIPGIELTPPDAISPFGVLIGHGWTWNTVLYKGVDYLPQGYIAHPSDVTVAAGASASFSTSAWPTPVGEQRIEWWRSNDNGEAWTRVRTSIVPTADTADIYTLTGVANADHGALFRARLCAVPRQASLAESCSDGIAARLSVLQGVVAASFVQQPRSLLVRTGQTASLSVQAEGSPAPSLRWQSRPANSSGTWVDVADGTGAATANFSTAALTLADNGLQLRAVANNLAGDVTSVPVTVSVSDIDVAPSVMTQPAALNVVAGSEAVFAVVARGTEALSYQWRRNGTPITGATAPVFKLGAVSAGDASGYSVQISNAAGSVTSVAATLTVSAGTPAAVAPSIVTQPVSATVNAGNTATLAVGVSGTGPFSYQWLHGGQAVTGATAAFYSVALASTGDSGTYTVQVSNASGNVTSSSATLTVVAAAQPVGVTVTTQPSPQVQAPGGSATFAVAATGTGPISYQWLKDGSPISGATSAVLNLTGLSGANMGSYAVTLSNTLGAVTSNAASLTVLGAPVINTQPAAVTANEGSIANFSVQASGTGLMYQWTHNQVAISGATSASYTTPALTLPDNGAVYSVVVYNGAGVAISQGAVLTVTAAPPPPAPAGLTAKAVATGYGSSFAVDLDGTVWAWGNLVDPTTGGYKAISPFASQPVKIQGLSGVKSITAVSESAAFYALHDDGTVSAWGRNNAGQLGDRTTGTRNLPVPVMLDATNRMTGICKIAGGPNAMVMAPCIAGTVWMVGLLSQSNFGGDSAGGATANGALAKAIPGLPNNKVVKALAMPDAAANALGSLLIVYDNETVFAWGQQSSNTLGAGVGVTNVGTVAGPISVWAGMGSVESAELGRDFSIVQGVDFRLKSVGRNLEGQLGIGSYTAQTDRISVNVLDIVSRFSVGQADVAAIQDGQLWVWGWNSGRVLTQPTRLGSEASYTEVSMGDIHGLAIGAGGVVYAWGDGTYGALGNGQSSAMLPEVVTRP